MIKYESTGDDILGGLEDIKNIVDASTTDMVEVKGVSMLAEATPKRTGLTASLWGVEKEQKKNITDVMFTNGNTTVEGTPVVTLLVQGHGTRTGGYVTGNDFITPVTDQLVDMLEENIEGRLNGK